MQEQFSYNFQESRDEDVCGPCEWIYFLCVALAIFYTLYKANLAGLYRAMNARMFQHLQKKIK